MAQKYSAFSYKYGNSFLHKMPAWIKLLLIPAINIAVFCLPYYVSIGFLILQFILCCILHFTIREQFEDLKPVIYYAILLYFFNLISSSISTFIAKNELSFYENIKAIGKASLFNKETFLMLVKLFCIMQSASIVYKTSTSLEIREGIGIMEAAVRKFLHLKQKLTLTNTISLFVTFIPMVFSVWTKTKKAWYARQGKGGIKMYMTLLPVLFSVGMKQAYNSAKAVSIRN